MVFRSVLLPLRLTFYNLMPYKSYKSLNKLVKTIGQETHAVHRIQQKTIMLQKIPASITLYVFLGLDIIVLVDCATHILSLKL